VGVLFAARLSAGSLGKQVRRRKVPATPNVPVTMSGKRLCKSKQWTRAGEGRIERLWTAFITHDRRINHDVPHTQRRLESGNL
jgi:hypothetical protein